MSGQKVEIDNDQSEAFKEAIEDDVDSEEVFEVTPEELSLIRADLACEFPDEYDYLSDAYILSVASKPYSKDPTVRRPIEYTMEKLRAVMTWREEAGAPALEDWIKLANGPTDAPEAVENPAAFTKAKALANSLNYGSMYWHGLDKKGRPILWIRTNRMPWYPDVEAQVNALMVLADAGIKLMPKDITDFVVISDSNSPPPPNPSFMINLLNALVKGYPDRLNLLVSVPVGSIIQFVMGLLTPLMPSRLASKLVLISKEDAESKLCSILENGIDDIPTFLEGKCDHDKLYPADGVNRGQGNLKFDYYGMVDRLQAKFKEFAQK
mmetsp:Transcript_19719/g.27719  ORF Transcript_19719/g.27719 Transcript_19719/m.27719 type:complete len:323 (+) Transcript_19719:92-1060(+)|eukprot:CAMPEP_0184862850 /NCGR_PEP_ID=MMETSP0580-20130426/8109_1 /TAXON_ID=1118495 /ORGANISM="Dactyliosolen fragilissimus" /LENGTH=322 /DNA_ID=CAMNT_0027360861 /DNA_START=47 /DNA_END=1015 /DNA_ORIENTATION=+